MPGDFILPIVRLSSLKIPAWPYDGLENKKADRALMRHGLLGYMTIHNSLITPAVVPTQPVNQIGQLHRFKLVLDVHRLGRGAAKEYDRSSPRLSCAVAPRFADAGAKADDCRLPAASLAIGKTPFGHLSRLECRLLGK
ncbi:MAG TPA: hypothetical protein VED19_00070 [Candidatus Nitrosopolaris sp.]|nr:hypothetical protein [Candidatus Nitrosopolaris sp.]